MSQFNNRAFRLFTALGVCLIILIAIGYHELASEDPYLASSFRTSAANRTQGCVKQIEPALTILGV